MALLRSTLFALAVGALVTASPPAPARAQETPKPDAAKAAPSPLTYPKQIKVAGRRVMVHEPTVLGAAVSSTEPTGAGLTFRFPLEVVEPSGGVGYGMIETRGAVHVDLQGRAILLDQMEVVRSAMPSLPEADQPAALTELAADLPKEFLLRLELLTARPGAAALATEEVGKLNADPPRILVCNVPTVLVQIDGEPAMEKLEEFPLEYVANSASDLFHEPVTGKWWYLLDGLWLTSKSLEGPWDWAGKSLPILLSQLPATHPRGHIRRWVSGTPEFREAHAKSPPEPSGPAPAIVVTREPAELVVLHGDPLFTLVPLGSKAKLMQVANTESDLFFHPKSDLYYLTLSGRWYTTPELTEPFKRVYGSLPPEFSDLPPDHPRAHIRWVVPGTPESLEALAHARLAPVVTVKKKIGADVRYVGDKPTWAPLVGGALQVATNTEDDLLTDGERFFICTRGLWFASNNSRSGFEPTTELPEAIWGLDASSGCYHVVFARPRGATDTGIEFATSAGFHGVFEFKGGVVYGTGWSKTGLLRNYNWYPQRRSYGENRWYDPLTGIFQPRTVRYTEDGKPTASAWSDYVGSYGRVTGYANRYEQGGRRMFPYRSDSAKFDTEAGRPDLFERWPGDVILRDGLPTDRFPLANRTAELAATEAATPGATATPAPLAPSPLVCDADGNVFRRIDGRLQQYKDGKWVSASADAAVTAWIDTFQRVNDRPAQLRRWAAARRAALPVNPTVTPMGK